MKKVDEFYVCAKTKGHSYFFDTYDQFTDWLDDPEPEETKDIRPYLQMPPDFDKVIKTCERFIDGLDEEIYTPKNIDMMEHYIFEEIIDTLYGEDAWEWINKKIEEANE